MQPDIPRSAWKGTCCLVIVAVVIGALALLADRANSQAACDAPFVVLNAPDGVDPAVLQAADGYLASVYGADTRMHVLAFYSDYDDIHAVLGRYAAPQLADLSGFSMARIRWNATECRYDRDSRTMARVAMASTRFEGGTLFGLAVHELAHLYQVPDGDGTGMDASWWERTANHAYAGTCGQLDAVAGAHCAALASIATE